MKRRLLSIFLAAAMTVNALPASSAAALAAEVQEDVLGEVQEEVPGEVQEDVLEDDGTDLIDAQDTEEAGEDILEEDAQALFDEDFSEQLVEEESFSDDKAEEGAFAAPEDIDEDIIEEVNEFADGEFTLYLDPNDGVWDGGSTEVKSWTGSELWSPQPNPFTDPDDEFAYDIYRDMHSLVCWSTEPDGSGDPKPGEDGWYHFDESLDGQTLYAVWARTIPVQFDFNGGLSNDSETVDRWATEGVPSEISFEYDEYEGPDGAILQGWKDEKTGQFYAMDAGGCCVIPSPYEGMVLTAVWTEAITVTYIVSDMNGYLDAVENGDYITYVRQAEVTVPKGTPISLDRGVQIENYGNKHYEFCGWKIEGDDSGHIYDPYDDADTVVLEESVNVYAVIREYFWVNAYLNGGKKKSGMVGSNWELIQARVYAGETFHLSEDAYFPPESDEEEVYLLGWTQEQLSTWVQYAADEEITITADTVLYAVWSNSSSTGEVLVEVRWHFNDAGYDHQQMQTVISGEAIPYPSVDEWEGHTFSYWYDESGNKYYPGEDTIYAGTGNMDLYAYWEETSSPSETAVITWNLTGGTYLNNEGVPTEGSKTKEVEVDDFDYYDDAIVEEFSFARPGYVLAGWSKDPDASEADFDWEDENLTGDITLYAIWEKAYVITLDLGDGTNMEGGYRDPETALWVTDDKTVKFLVAQGDLFEFDSSVFSNEFEYDGKELAYYYYLVPEYGDEIHFVPNDVFAPQGNMTLKAFWEDLITVSFNPNGGYWYNDPAISYQIAENYKKNDKIWGGPGEVSKDGYVLIGWSLDPASNENVIDKVDGFEIKEAVTFFAIWGEEAWITFDANGGIVKFTDDEEVYKFRYPRNTHIYDIYRFCVKNEAPNDKFVAWTTKRNDPSTRVSLNDSKIENCYYLTEDVTLYALWQSTVTKLEQEKKAAEEQEKKEAEAKARAQKEAEAKAKAEQAAREAKAKKEAAQKAFTLNVKKNTTVPVQIKKTSKKVEVKTLAAGDKIRTVASSNKNAANAYMSGKTVVIKAGKKKGTTEITVMTQQGAVWKFKVKVQKAKVKLKGVKVAKKKLTLNLTDNKTFDLAGVTNPLTAAEKVKYKSLNKKIAAVSAKGIVTARKKGKTTIIVSAGKKKVKVKVTVK